LDEKRGEKGARVGEEGKSGKKTWSVLGGGIGGPEGDEQFRKRKKVAIGWPFANREYIHKVL